METAPQPWLGALRASHDRLEGIVRPLDADAIRGGSYCSEWTIAQVLSHLGSGAVLFGLILDAAIEGREPPARESFAEVWDTWNAYSPDEQVERGLEVDGAFVARFEGLGDDELARLSIPMMGMQLDAAGLLRLRLGEHAVHTWDVAVVLDPAATIGDEAVGLVIDGLGMVVSRAGKPEDPARRLRVRTTNPSRDLLLNTGEPVKLGAWEDGAADGEISLAAEALIRLAYGRLSELPSGTDVSLDELRRVFPGL
jgi:uncharacterized protein (TIGR03083 family)